jgi:hypothetical protein
MSVLYHGAMNNMDIRQFLNEAESFEAIVNKIAELADNPSVTARADLSGFLLVLDGHTNDKFTIPALACQALLQHGPDGVRSMASLIGKSEGRILPSMIVYSLWHAAHGEINPSTNTGRSADLPLLLRNTPSEDTVIAARLAFREFVARSQNDPESFSLLVHWMDNMQMKFNLDPTIAERVRSEVFRVISESSKKNYTVSPR